MELKGEAKLLRIFIGESDKFKHLPLHEAIVQEAKRQGLAGATALRGILSYGATSKIHTAKVLDLSVDLPVIIEAVDDEERINAFLPVLHDMFEEAQSGGLVTLEKVEVIKYVPRGGSVR